MNNKLFFFFCVDFFFLKKQKGGASDGGPMEDGQATLTRIGGLDATYAKPNKVQRGSTKDQLDSMLGNLQVGTFNQLPKKKT